MMLSEHQLIPPCTKQVDPPIRLRFIPLFDVEHIEPDQVSFLWRQLQRVLPDAFFFANPDEAIEKNRLFPKIDCVPIPGSGSAIQYCSFLAVAKYRPNAFKFFFEMITRWVVPGKRLDAVSVLPDFSLDRWTFCEVKIAVNSR